jgi:hypothetical protein
MERNTGIRTEEFEMSSFIGILKAFPSAHVIDTDCLEWHLTTDHILEQCAQALAILNDYASLAGVLVSLGYSESVFLCVLLNSETLICN